MRSNPRMRTVKSVLRTYIDVLHIQLNQKDVLFAGRGKLEAGGDTASQPGTPRSQADSECGSQVRPCLVWPLLIGPCTAPNQDRLL